MACGFNFEEAYGELGRGFIEFHHIVPISELEQETIIDLRKDLVCLNANCHRMVHRKHNSNLSLNELKALLEIQKKQTK